jgi:hypothetical protein
LQINREIFRDLGEPVSDRFAAAPQVTEETIARLLTVEAAGWKEHHDTLPLNGSSADSLDD